MAVKRMFSSSVTETDNFLELPLKSQALYFHLGMQGDDDGFVANPRAIIRSIGCTARDLKPLETAGYVISFPSKVLVITDWKANNNLRNDRYKPTAFQNELAQLKEKVEQSGKSQQQYIIEALTQSNIVNLDGLKEIYPELKRQGNNLNQIAKKLNENGYVDYKQELPNTMKEVREVWQLLKQYLQKQA